jgi:serine/threonine-protein kinase RsbW
MTALALCRCATSRRCRHERLQTATVEVRLPSRMGFEKVAMSTAAAVAKLMGFREDRVEDLKTAVAEACINAIEHGNRLNEKLSVGVVMSAGADALEVKVIDDGKGMKKQPARPDIDRKMHGEEDPARDGNVSHPGAGGRGGVGGRLRRQKQLCPTDDSAG